MNEYISTRMYLPQDADATINIFLRAIREVASKDYSPVQIEAWAQVDNPHAWAEHRLTRPAWVAEHDGKVIGFTDLTADGYLDMMYVHPEFQGKGVASRLIVLVENEAKKLGLCRLYTEASLTARPFFECKGFIIVKSQTVEKRGQLLDNFVMEKKYTH